MYLKGIYKYINDSIYVNNLRVRPDSFFHFDGKYITLPTE